MRIIHTADLHLDSSFEANLNSIKAKERKRELLLSFEALVNYAKENNVKAIIIAGDLFDKPRVSMKTRDFILDVGFCLLKTLAPLFPKSKKPFDISTIISSVPCLYMLQIIAPKMIWTYFLLSFLHTTMLSK